MKLVTDKFTNSSIMILRWLLRSSTHYCTVHECNIVRAAICVLPKTQNRVKRTVAWLAILKVGTVLNGTA